MRDISLHLMDIIQNSVAAEAENIKIKIFVDITCDELSMSIEDDGLGISEDLIKIVEDPFVTTRDSRKVGFGISLFKDSCEKSGGRFLIMSKQGSGTIVSAVFKRTHIDRPPLGSISDTIITNIVSYPDLDIELLIGIKDKDFVFSTKAVKGQLLDININHYEVISWIKEYIDEGIENIFGGVLDEVGSRT